MRTTTSYIVALLFVGTVTACAPSDFTATPVPTITSTTSSLPNYGAGLTPTTTTTATAQPKCTIVDGKADRRCTPGATNSQVTQANIKDTICKSGWTATIRPSTSFTNALKEKQKVDYGLANPNSAYEEDHLIPLELGGAPSAAANLWPEPINSVSTGAKSKDVEENSLKARVCKGQMTLTGAQELILAHWRQ
jgi:hypothetical protein